MMTPASGTFYSGTQDKVIIAVDCVDTSRDRIKRT